MGYCEIEKGFCFLRCKDYRKGRCIGYYSTVVLPNGAKIRIPLNYREINNYYEEFQMEVHKNGFITKEEIFKILKEKYGLNFSKRNLQFYVTQGLIEPGVIERVPGVTGSVSFYSEKVPEQIYAIDRFKKLGVKIRLNDIKYYLNLMKFFSKQETYQNEDTIKKLDILTFQELKNLKMEDTFVKGIILSDKYTKKQKNKVIKEFPVFHTEITFLTRWDLLEELIEALAYASLDFEEIKELRKKYEDWQIEPILDNPAVETNIDIIDEKNIEQTFIFAKYDKPVSKTVYFKYHEIEVL